MDFIGGVIDGGCTRWEEGGNQQRFFFSRSEAVGGLEREAASSVVLISSPLSSWNTRYPHPHSHHSSESTEFWVQSERNRDVRV